MSITADLRALIRSRHTLLWIVSREEKRVERAIADVAADLKYEFRTWDCVRGICALDGKQLADLPDPSRAIADVRDRLDRCVYVFRDLHAWSDPVTTRGLRSLARDLQGAPRGEARAIVVLSPSANVPPELTNHATILEWPMPDRAEIAALLDQALEVLPDEIRATAVTDTTRDAVIDAAIGLSAEETANTFARSLVLTKTIAPAAVASEKKRVIARERVLTWHDPDPRGLDAVGGLDVLKGWLMQRRAAFSVAARAYGLPAPKGALLVGVSGCGKSLTAKAVASAYAMPLLRLDMGALKSKYVGESETNLRRALQVAETVSPCVLWLDEIEKALAGATGPAGDGGVAADALGAVLSWMQERSGSVFVVATANDVSGLPPEFLRKGRFDDVFFVDLPTSGERADVLASALRAHGRTEAPDLAALARATAGFTGAELAALVPEAMFAAFADGARPVTTDDLLVAARTVVPLSKTASEKIAALRTWAKERARPASTPEATTGSGGGRALDL